MTHPARDVDGIKEAPAEGVFIYGLFLDGCAWSARENRLVDSDPKKLFHPLPVLYVTGVQVSSNSCLSHVLDIGSYGCTMCISRVCGSCRVQIVVTA